MSIVRGCFSVAVLVSLVATGALAQVKPASPPAKASGAARAAAPNLRGVGSARDIMEALTIPASDAVFAAGAEPPKDDAGWSAVQRQALVVAESANLLLVPPRAIATGSWTKWSVAQRDAAVAAMKAAQAKNGDALSTAADALYETCAGCHKVYLPSK